MRALAVCLAGAALAAAAGSLGGSQGSLVQLPGAPGCLSFTGRGGCTRVSTEFFRGWTISIAFSRDGRVVTVGSFTGTIVLRRDRSTGRLTPLQGPGACIARPSRGGARPGCVEVSGVTGTGPAAAVGPEERTAYAGATVGMGFYLSPAVVEFRRDPRSGRLQQTTETPACFESSVSHKCIAAKNLGAAIPIVSRDGKNLYTRVGSAVWTLTRDPATGVLTQLPDELGCVRDPHFIPNRRNGCVLARGLRGIVRDQLGLVQSPDGRNVYATSFGGQGGIAAFRRNPRDGALEQLRGKAGCVVNSGLGGACARARGIFDAVSSAISPDGRNLYTVSSRLAPASTPTSNALVIFRRNPRTGALTQLPGTAGCVNGRGFLGCAKGTGLFGAVSVAVSPDGRTVYTASFYDKAVAAFRRDPKTGAVSQLPGSEGCATSGLYKRARGICAQARFALGESVAVSPDGRNVYAGSVEPEAPGDGLLAVFSRRR